MCSEWAVNIQRDSYASYVGHYPILAYFAFAENESIGRERYNFMQVCFGGLELFDVIKLEVPLFYQGLFVLLSLNDSWWHESCRPRGLSFDC